MRVSARVCAGRLILATAHVWRQEDRFLESVLSLQLVLRTISSIVFASVLLACWSVSFQPTPVSVSRLSGGILESQVCAMASGSLHEFQESNSSFQASRAALSPPEPSLWPSSAS